MPRGLLALSRLPCSPAAHAPAGGRPSAALDSVWRGRTTSWELVRAETRRTRPGWRGAVTEVAIGGGKRTIGEHGQSCAEREQVGPGWHGMGGSGLAMGRLRGGTVRPVVVHHAGTGMARAAGVMWRRSAILGSTCLWAGCDGRLLTPRVGSLFASSMRMFSVSMQRA